MDLQLSEGLMIQSMFSRQPWSSAPGVSASRALTGGPAQKATTIEGKLFSQEMEPNPVCTFQSHLIPPLMIHRPK